MSSGYRYVVFAPGKQPTVEEVAALDELTAQTSQRYAVGINGDDAALALAFEARAFEAARSTSRQFATLLNRWEVRSCEVRKRLLFIKKPTALQPMPGELLHRSLEPSSEAGLKRKQSATQEALGRAGLKLQRKLQQHTALQRVARVIPYALMGMSALLTIVAGIYFGQRLLDADAERRRDTIQRVSQDAMSEQLTRKANKVEQRRHNEHNVEDGPHP